RYISNSSLFEELLQLCKKDENIKRSIGGNAPIMAVRFAKEGITNVLLGSQMSETLKQFLPSDIRVAGPSTTSDEVHLLLEYPAGETWGDFLVSPRANRFIIHNDVSNSLLSSLEIFHEEVKKFNPKLFVVGGLQMMDNFPDTKGERKERLLKVESFLKELTANKETLVHFEMASFSDQSLLRYVTEYILPYVDSIGMNEQELPNLYHMQMFGNTTLVSDAYPRVATVLDQMRDLYSSLYAVNKGKISRIHVHTLAFQAILVRSQSKWKNARAAAAKAALTAHRHTCGSDDIDIARTKLIMDDSFTTTRNNDSTKRRIHFNETQPVACWKEDFFQDKHPIEICVAPVLVCTKVLQTGGGGDNVSAAGLVVQVA
ncbi:ADP-dependent glucokinase-like protein, partial [Dinothrombium tinctorium]